MTTPKFHILTQPQILDGKHKLNSSVSTLYNGMLLKLNSNGELVLPTAETDEIAGVAYEPAQVGAFSWPQDENIATTYAGKYLTIAKGRFEALLSKSFFVGGSVPATIGTRLYNATGGYYKTSGTTPAIGTIVGFSRLHNSDDPELAESYEVLARVDMHIRWDAQ